MDDLIRRLKDGDETAFNELVSQYSRKLYYLCLKMLGNAPDAEDAVQNAFLKAYMNISKFEEKSSVSTWLYRVTVNVCMDILRKRKKDGAISLYQTDEDDKEYALDIADETENVESKILEEERKRALYKAIDNLKPKHKELIILRDIEGLPYDEIADVLKMNVGTVKSGINRARAYLLEKLKENKELFS